MLKSICRKWHVCCNKKYAVLFNNYITVYSHLQHVYQLFFFFLLCREEERSKSASIDIEDCSRKKRKLASEDKEKVIVTKVYTSIMPVTHVTLLLIGDAVLSPTRYFTSAMECANPQAVTENSTHLFYLQKYVSA